MFSHVLVKNTKTYDKYFIFKEYNKNTLNFEKEYIVNVLHADELFGDTLLFCQNNTFLGDGIATTKLKFTYISKENLIHLLKDSIILTNYLSLISNKTLAIKNKLKLLSQKNLRERILFYLGNYSKEHNTKIIPIKSKEILANILNIPIPSLSRELINLANDVIIEASRKAIKLL